MSDIKIKPEVRALADKMKANLVLDENGGIGGVDDLYEEFLTENNTTLEERKKIQKQDGTFLSSLDLAVGEFSIERMTDDKKLDQTFATVQMGINKADVTTRRVAEVSNGKGGRMNKYGMTSIKYRHRIALTNEKAHLSQLAEAALKG